MYIDLLNNYCEKIFAIIYDTCYEYYKGLTKNPKWLLMRKIARFKIGRIFITNLTKTSTKTYLTSINLEKSCLVDVDVDEVVKNLQSDGLHLGINLPPHIVKEIVQFAKSTACYGNRRPELGFYYDQKQAAQRKSAQQFTIADYFNTEIHCYAIKKLQNDPKLLAIAAKYLNTYPAHQGNRMWWSFPVNSSYTEQIKAAQCFHYDLDDYKFIKFFFYLTDVDNQSGPHVCMRGSHKRKKSAYIWLRKRETDKDIINYYGQESLIEIYGKAGFGFAEDPLCFHKGIPPTHKDRLILQIEFATTDYQMQHDIRPTSQLKLVIGH
ncbi:phytanoyl-CoA dioxygenase family protein [Anabaena azotica]|uniref:Phytanoyl-CoA dioxygenase n=1 Tax=Anabaena azotica FACHB-119 TaxID=947527 RepID=A0ABR8D3U3_9NOST|nr:hypothetical protein [Anabaena azotica]MBD2501601.1 hypothetical protein [Anabaena azotica FACHB-119]